METRRTFVKKTAGTSLVFGGGVLVSNSIAMPPGFDTCDVLGACGIAREPDNRPEGENAAWCAVNCSKPDSSDFVDMVGRCEPNYLGYDPPDLCEWPNIL